MPRGTRKRSWRPGRSSSAQSGSVVPLIAAMPAKPASRKKGGQQREQQEAQHMRPRAPALRDQEAGRERHDLPTEEELQAGRRPKQRLDGEQEDRQHRIVAGAVIVAVEARRGDDEAARPGAGSQRARQCPGRLAPGDCRRQERRQASAHSLPGPACGRAHRGRRRQASGPNIQSAPAPEARAAT